MSMFDVEKFIREVEKRPLLYNATLPEYSNRETKLKCWMEIGQEMFPDWKQLTNQEKTDKGKELIKKWKAIRDNLVKDLRNQNTSISAQAGQKKKRYIYYKHLQFLLPFVGIDKETFSNTPPSETSADSVMFEKQRNGSAEERLSVKKRKTENILVTTTKRINNVLSQSVTLQQEERESDKMGNKSFLLSFLPIMNDLPNHLALEARFRITEVFRNISNVANRLTFPATSSSPSTTEGSHVSVDSFNEDHFSINDFVDFSGRSSGEICEYQPNL